MDEVVLGMEGGPYQEYFYVELPMSISDSDSSATYRRFVYVKDDKEGSVTRFPMSFGLEVRNTKLYMTFVYPFLLI